MVKNRPEILAPAGSMEALRAAVFCGADAVYLGGVSFNARRNAKNFTPEELAEGIRFCHIRGVKVYLTLNTMIFQRELEEVAEALRSAARLGVDALILSDLGTAALAREICPSVARHASTQMTVHSREGIEALKELGFCRVVLPRELAAEEIAALTRCGMETEIFVHGAHCMSVSGQCLLSAVMGGRSGNRGECAQPCRLPFSLGKKEEYGLSLKDLSLVSRLEEIAGMGVTSLKIEGRMKGPAYVASAVTAVREGLEGALTPQRLSDLQNIFSRGGFTSGYFDRKVDGGMFGVRSAADKSATLAAEKEYLRLAEKSTPRVALQGEVSLQADVPMTLTLRDGEGREVCVSGEVPQPARNLPLTEEKLSGWLSKTGGTPFYLDRLELRLEEGLSLPAAAVNQLRRQALEELEEQRGAVSPVELFSPVPVQPRRAAAKGLPSLRGYFRRAEQIPPSAVSVLEEIILPLSQLKKAGGIPPEKLRIALPRMLLPGREGQRKKLLDALRAQGITKVLTPTLDGLQFARKEELSPLCWMTMNLSNEKALEQIARLGGREAVLSAEVSPEHCGGLRQILPIGGVIYGRLPLMLMRSCPLHIRQDCTRCDGAPRTLRDRTGTQFPLLCNGDGFSELYNSRPIYLGERWKGFPLDFGVLVFTLESREECDRIIDRYCRGLPPAPGTEFSRGIRQSR